jgi:hypothetical protein
MAFRPRKVKSLEVNTDLVFSNDKAIAKWNATRNCFELDPGGYGISLKGVGVDSAPDRVHLYEGFEKAPQLSAVTQAPAGNTYATAEFLASLAANRYFEVLGTNAVSADVAKYAEGGISVATHGAQNDSTIILPHLTSNQSPWKSITWGTDQRTRWSCNFQTPAAVTSCIIWAGLKLTNTPTVATDDNQAYIMLDTGASASATYWHAIYSKAGTDTDTAITSTAVGAPGVAVAATNYYFVIDIDSSRVARFYINGFKCLTSAALTDAIDLIPYFGIKDLSAGSARTAYLFRETISRKPGA